MLRICKRNCFLNTQVCAVYTVLFDCEWVRARVANWFRMLCFVSRNHVYTQNLVRPNCVTVIWNLLELVPCLLRSAHLGERDKSLIVIVKLMALVRLCVGDHVNDQQVLSKE
jgi:hypothetical protein